MATQASTAFLPVGMKPSDSVPITNPKNLEAVYSNNFGLSATMTDFTIYFLEIGQVPGAKGATVEKQELKAIVTLPLMAVGGLQQVLQQIQDRMKKMMRQAQENAQAQVKANTGGKK